VAASTEYFPVPAARALLDRLNAVGHDEASAFLVHARTPLTQLASDLANTSGWTARGRLLLGHLFPPAAYMRKTFGVSSVALLPWLYTYRIVRGAGRWLRGRAS
jgi:hypothetical protein